MRWLAILLLALASTLLRAGAQTPHLDPSRDVPVPAANAQSPLPEQYIWTSGQVTALRPDHSRFPWNRPDLRTQIHYFRTHFQVGSVPQCGTLYIAGPRWVRAWLNGTLLGEFSTSTDQPINFQTFHADASRALRRGDNVLSIELIRGRGVVAATDAPGTQQLAYGEVLAAKIVAGPFGDAESPRLVVSDPSWRSQVDIDTSGWQSSNFDDSAWPRVQSLGPIESNINFRQWSADAGMYGWPGYRGMSSFLRSFTIPATAVTHLYPGTGSFEHIDALTSQNPGSPFTVHLNEAAPTDSEAPTLLLDFGREIAGRLRIDSASDQPTTVSIAYGESELEALATGIDTEQRGGNYLGTNIVRVPARGIALGPKSGFRYVRIRFLRGAPITALRSIRAEVIEYPVRYIGSFESSDPVLNNIWTTAAYTAHLCMQDDLWDAPKRDRGRWAGDLDIEGNAILTAFGDTFLLEDTLRQLTLHLPPGQPVSGIPGYTAAWINALATLYQHSADQTFLTSQRNALLQALHTLDDQIDPSTGLLSSSAKGWLFVDWAPGLYGANTASRIGTTLEFLRAYQAAPALLHAIGEDAAAQHYEEKATTLAKAARAAYLDPSTHTVGTTWQLNALAMLTGMESPDDTAAWTNAFAHVQQITAADQQITPYFNAYLLDAMSLSGHSAEALQWMRTYWGGMLAEGATSFWEAYDLRWPKTDAHLSLQADGTSGFFVSLAHGWSSGPLAWISENILGIRPSAPGYASVDLRPDLLGLKYAHGSVATPHGPILVSLSTSQGLTLDLPAGVEHGRLFLPHPAGSPTGAPIVLTHSGHYHFALP